MEFIAPLIGFVGFLYMVGWIVSTVVSGRRRTLELKARADLNTRILEKHGSGREFVEFLQSEGGQKFLDFASAEPVGPVDRVLASIQRGTVLALVGVACLLVRATTSLDQNGLAVMTFIGLVLLAMGIGFLISALVSYRLSRNLGLVRTREEARQ